MLLEQKLDCPCTDEFTCAFHSIPHIPEYDITPKEMMDKIKQIYNDSKISDLESQ